MSNPIPTKQVEKALTEKGFRCLKDKRDHRFYYFFYNGKKTIVKTKISRGSGYKDYNDNLFELMKKQLRLNLKQTRGLFDCSLSHTEYVQILSQQGMIDKK